ncbi:MAG: carboxypeptidase regulatory-like domain-containing protein [Planctomycetes bacterium]|nr:carboxypeptidase regulatory-like domain-containing protein [Planctomycetota bacterium]
MRTPGLVVVFLLLIAGAIFCWSGLAATPAPILPTAGDVAAASPEVQRAEPVAMPTATQAATERDLAAVSPPAVADFRLSGRCLDAATRQPLASIDVIAARDDDAWFHGDWATERELARTTTAGDGRFELRVAAAPTILARLEAQDRARLTGRWPAPAGGAVDVGDILLLAARRVHGEVVDDLGAPVGDVHVILLNARPVPPGFALRDGFSTDADGSGRFAMPWPVPVGDYYVGVNRGGALVSPRQVDIVAGTGPFPLRVVLEHTDPAATIHGRVTDVLGTPMAGVSLEAIGDGAGGTAISRADGSFALRKGGPRPDDGKTGVRLMASEQKGLHEQAEPIVVAWGKREVVVAMRPLAMTTLVVTDGLGMPIADHDAFVLRDNDDLVQTKMVSARGNTDGRVRIDKLRVGKYRVLVRPVATPAQASPLVPFEVVPEGAPRAVAVQLRPACAVTVEVAGTDGAAVVGTRVDAIAVLAGKPPEQSAELPLLSTLRAKDLLRQASLVMATADSDAAGRVVLRLHPGTYELRLRGPLHVATARSITVTGDMTVPIAVEAGGRLAGQLGSAAAVARVRSFDPDPTRELTVVANPVAGGVAAARAVVDGGGAFVLAGLRPGPYELQLLVHMRCNSEHAGVVALPIDRIDLPAGETPRAFAIDGALPGSVVATVTLDGRPWPRAQTFLVRAGAKRTSIRSSSDEHGVVRSLLPPGEYTANVAFAANPGPGWITVPLPFRWRIEAGKEAAVALAARNRSLRVRLLAADGTPLPQARVRVDGPTGYSRTGPLTSDGEGVVRIEHVPYGPFDLRVTTAAGELRLGPVELGEAADAAAVDARPRGP